MATYSATENHIESHAMCYAWYLTEVSRKKTKFLTLYTYGEVEGRKIDKEIIKLAPSNNKYSMT